MTTRELKQGNCSLHTPGRLDLSCSELALKSKEGATTDASQSEALRVSIERFG